jgi:hypothetical protein
MNAHRDGSYALMDQRLGRHNELNVGAVRRGRVHVGCGEQLRGLQLGQFGQRHDGMRVPHADGQGGPCDFESRGADQRIHGPRGGLAREDELPGAHVDGVPGGGTDDRLGAAPGTDGQ